MGNSVFLAFLFTLLAGLSTGVGSALAFFADRTNTRFLAGSLGFSAGVMLYVSFVELLGEARKNLSTAYDNAATGDWIAVAAFFAGMGLITIIDKLVPEVENPHEVKRVEDMRAQPEETPTANVEIPDRQARRSNTTARLMRTGTLTALVIGIHNFPEGLATFMSTLQDTGIGFSIAIAIAIHNIPEGIAVSVPIYYATGNKKKAFLWSFLSGLTEPLGALIGYILLVRFMTPEMSAIILAAVAGIMVFISLDELLPAAERYGEHHLSIYGAVAGMVVMALSLLLLA